jgi:GNAT superfamily N-acetyltransferase
VDTPTSPPPAGADYAVRRLRPEDAAGVAECARRVYGTSYVHPEVYRPDELVRLNRTGRLVSVVALDPAGRVVGHSAVERPDLGPVGETGEAMVVPEHRRHGLMERMHAALLGEAARLGLAGVYGMAVTNHVFTQKMYGHFRAYPCAVVLGLCPRSVHNTADPPTQRLSCLLYFEYLRPPAAGRVYAPAGHRELIGRVYAQFGLAPEFATPGAPAGAGELAADHRAELGSATIRVRRCGADTADAVGRRARDLSAAGAEVVYLDLPLADPGTPELCRAAEADGFFFGGVCPHFADGGDVLRLQRLNVPLDTGLLQVESPFARELVAYAAGERARTGHGP